MQSNELSKASSPKCSRRQLLTVVVLLVFLLVALKSAWVCDDAFITMRTADNFLQGHGLTWNVTERVQAFTHPLWLAVLCCLFGILGNAYWTVIVAGLLCATIAVYLLTARIAASAWSAALAGGALVISKFFIDYTTSGMENPLSWLLAACFVLVYFHQPQTTRRTGTLALLTSLAILTRHDNVMLLLPPLLIAAWRGSWRSTLSESLRPLLLGSIPLLIWESFSIVYYGFPFPNTAYAKLGAGLNGLELGQQGLFYFAHTAVADPLLMLALVLTGLIAWRRRDRAQLPFIIGIVLYLLYVLRIGGCFMAGRFLVTPFFLAVLLLSRQKLTRSRSSYAVAGLLLLGLLLPRNPITSDLDYRHTSVYHGIADERGQYYWATGALKRLDGDYEQLDWVYAGRRARERASRESRICEKFPAVGFYGFEAGPKTHVIDPYALGDAFLARLPANLTAHRGGWRIGHYPRDIPAGYTETVVTGHNRLTEPGQAGLYDDLRRVVSGPIWSRERFVTIWHLNRQRFPVRP